MLSQREGVWVVVSGLVLMRGCICFLDGHVFVFCFVFFEFLCSSSCKRESVEYRECCAHVQVNKEFVTRKKQYLRGDVICGVSCQGNGERIYFFFFFTSQIGT